jgi:hypothetical protein
MHTASMPVPGRFNYGPVTEIWHEGCMHAVICLDIVPIRYFQFPLRVEIIFALILTLFLRRVLVSGNLYYTGFVSYAQPRVSRHVILAPSRNFITSFQMTIKCVAFAYSISLLTISLRLVWACGLVDKPTSSDKQQVRKLSK